AAADGAGVAVAAGAGEATGGREVSGVVGAAADGAEGVAPPVNALYRSARAIHFFPSLNRTISSKLISREGSAPTGPIRQRAAWSQNRPVPPQASISAGRSRPDRSPTSRIVWIRSIVASTLSCNHSCTLPG